MTSSAHLISGPAISRMISYSIGSPPLLISLHRQNSKRNIRQNLKPCMDWTQKFARIKPWKPVVTLKGIQATTYSEVAKAKGTDHNRQKAETGVNMETDERQKPVSTREKASGMRGRWLTPWWLISPLWSWRASRPERMLKWQRESSTR